MLSCERYTSSIEVNVNDIDRMARELGFSLDHDVIQEILTRMEPKLHKVAADAVENFIKAFLLGENTRGKDSKGAGNSSGDSSAAGRHIQETDLPGSTKE